MTTAQNLVEANLYRSYWDDGLLDLLFGIGLLMAGLGWESRLGALAVLQAPLWIVFWGPLRRRIVEPHAGFVRFSLSRQERTSRGLRWTLALGMGVLVLSLVAVLVLREQEALPALRRLSPGIPAFLVALGAALAGILTGARRFQAYGLVLLAGAAVTAWLDRGPALPLIVAALVAVISGAVLLGRFVRASREYREQG